MVMGIILQLMRFNAAKIFVALAVMAFLTFQVSTAKAQVGDPHPILMDPGLIVISSDTSFEDPALIKLFADRPAEAAIAQYISSAFEKEGLDVPVIDRSHFKGAPAGLQLERVLFANVRLDVASIKIEQSKSLVVGSASITFSRAGAWLLSPATMTFFGTETNDAELSDRASAAVFDQVTKSLVSPLLRMKH